MLLTNPFIKQRMHRNRTNIRLSAASFCRLLTFALRI